MTHDWQTRDQLLFKSTMFGDDIDRALQKADKTWTYFAADIASKVKYDILIIVMSFPFLQILAFPILTL